MKNLLNIFFYLLLASMQISVCNGQEKEVFPNIVVILADDLGYGDLSCYGSMELHTPCLDKLAAEGVRLTNFYSNGPECSPTRTALLTGRYQQRVGGLECAIGLGNIGRYEEALALSDKGELGLPVEFNILPNVLKQNGYNTAMIGKWHLGDGCEFSPQKHGFDYFIGPLGGAVDYFHHTEPKGVFLGTMMNGDHDLVRNGQQHHRDGYYITHLITDESVEWINIQKKNQPFFLYVPYTAPHEPLQGVDDYSPEKLTMRDWSTKNRETYIEMIEELDKGVGKILAKLEDKGIANNTLVIFFSDNGPTKIGNADPFSGYKGQVFEGGIRVPCIIKWPGKITPHTSSKQMAISMDITASIARIVNGRPSKPLDGIDIIGHITEEKPNFPRTLYWRKLRGNTVFKAVRDDNLKYICNDNGSEVSEYLFNLSTDPAEKNNLKDSQKENFKSLKRLLDKWEDSVQPERY